MTLKRVQRSERLMASVTQSKSVQSLPIGCKRTIPCVNPGHTKEPTISSALLSTRTPITRLPMLPISVAIQCACQRPITRTRSQQRIINGIGIVLPETHNFQSEFQQIEVAPTEIAMGGQGFDTLVAQQNTHLLPKIPRRISSSMTLAARASGLSRSARR